ncbi:hypothetical protein I79_021359 [Cricetulus griseus]|uniref:Uncharacterized protein n=1 Tax=Cricetulus griseus TaxID=10029 RepID=G3ICG2_CRIGR|nr:hypothetical protein I79_021359 [Cricetulus griseus]
MTNRVFQGLRWHRSNITVTDYTMSENPWDDSSEEMLRNIFLLQHSSGLDETCSDIAY